MKFIELTTQNFDEYAKQIVDLCDQAVAINEQNNKNGQFYTSTLPELQGYVTSGKDLVVMAIDDNNKVAGAAYINSKVKQNTYSDFTKYFHYSSAYKNAVALSFPDKEKYETFIAKAYLEKILIFTEIAKEIESNSTLNPHSLSFIDLLHNQINNNEFQENNPIRRYITDRLYEEYEKTKEVDTYTKTAFYSLSDIDKEKFQTLIQGDLDKEKLKESICAYEVFLFAQKPVFITEPTIDMSQYFNANMNNSMEINTYIVAPEYQSKGLAKTLLYETLRKCMNKYFSNPENNELYLNTTIHNENTHSQRTANLIGLKDYIYIERTKGINRRVYFKRITKEEYPQYLQNIALDLFIQYNTGHPNADWLTIKKRIELQTAEYAQRLSLAKSIREKEYYKNKMEELKDRFNTEENKWRR